MTAIEVIERLRRGGVRVRTGLWLLPPADLGRLADQAARLGIDLADARWPLLDKVAPNQRFLGLNEQEVVEALDELCRQSQGSDCLLVANFDLLMAGLSYVDRQEVWEALYKGFPHRPRSLLLAMPAGAVELLPTEQQLDYWRQEGRLAP